MNTIAWGVVATVKAPLDEIRRFAAWHLSQGAAQVHLYLDAADGAAARALPIKGRVFVTQTHGRYWDNRGGRPDKHQVRQVRNAQNAVRNAQGLDWLAHIDVDEFLMPRGDVPVGDMLAALPPDCLCARIRPAEALAPLAPLPETYFKLLHPDRPIRRAQAARLFPNLGQHLPGGFLSHVAGKLVFRPAMADLKVRIHNVWSGDVQNPGEAALPDLDLLHFHAFDRDAWLAKFDYRLEYGAYRADLKSQTGAGDAITPHDLFRLILSEQGKDGLSAFFDEVATARPALLRGLQDEGLLLRHSLDFAGAVRAQYGT